MCARSLTWVERKRERELRTHLTAPPPGVLVLLRGEHLQRAGAEEPEQRRFLLHLSPGQLRRGASSRHAELRRRPRRQHRLCSGTDLRKGPRRELPEREHGMAGNLLQPVASASNSAHFFLSVGRFYLFVCQY